jgi:hypothetical protein
VGPPARTKGKGAALASKTAPEGCPRRCGGNGLRTYPAKSAGCMVTAGLISGDGIFGLAASYPRRRESKGP